LTDFDVASSPDMMGGRPLGRFGPAPDAFAAGMSRPTWPVIME
jgi:hypothetical protein